MPVQSFNYMQPSYLARHSATYQTPATASVMSCRMVNPFAITVTQATYRIVVAGTETANTLTVTVGTTALGTVDLATTAGTTFGTFSQSAPIALPAGSQTFATKGTDATSVIAVNYEYFPTYTGSFAG